MSEAYRETPPPTREEFIALEERVSAVERRTKVSLYNGAVRSRRPHHGDLLVGGAGDRAWTSRTVAAVMS